MIITLIVAVVITIAWLIWMLGTYKEDGRDMMISSLLVFFIVMILGVSATLGVHYYTAKYETVLLRNTRVYSFEEQETEESSFVLYTSTINGDKVYLYKTKKINGELQIEHVPVGSTLLIESDSQTPQIRCYQDRQINSNWWTDFGTLTDSKERYELVIPINNKREVYRGTQKL